MVIFNSYVSLPEGNSYDEWNYPFGNQTVPGWKIPELAGGFSAGKIIELLNGGLSIAMCDYRRVKHVTLWLCQNSYWKWPFIVDFPIENGDFL